MSEKYQPYNPQETEPEIYKLWEEHEAFKPNLESTKNPKSILLPPPNANADLHLGHAMYVIEDILARFWRMQGHPTLWIPGTDHAGYETQYVYEKHLKKEGKSRFDFDRKTLYDQVAQFVKENSGVIQGQLKQLGFSLDWSRETFMLEDRVVNTVLDTFEKMYTDGLIYRGGYMVNYCPKCGTTFANLEIKHLEQKDSLYYMKYGPFTLATVRPETKFGDTAVAVNPNDTRYQKYIGQEIEVDGLLGKFKLKVIADDYVDPEFGTGVVKITPAHDPNDYEIGKRHNLEIKSVIDLNGRLNELTGPYEGMTVFSARKKVVEDLKEKGLLVKIDENYTHNISVCYKGNHPIEPMVLPNWFVKMEPLAKPAIKAVQEKKVKIIPKRFEKIYFQWMENIHDWPISRQVVWGIRIPAWYSVEENPDLQITFINKNKESIAGNVQDLCGKYSLKEIEEGLQTLLAPSNANFIISRQKPGEKYLPETDSFDTWFSSGQWPLTTLNYPKGEDFKKFYPTTLLDTMWDILFFWVARMIMFGLFLTEKPPFEYVYLHSMVTDKQGKKMSKSKGNVINPIEIVQKYGADALRMSLMVGAAPGNPIALSEEKIKGYRNFSNKIWNAHRFVTTNYNLIVNEEKHTQSTPKIIDIKNIKQEENTAIITRTNEVIIKVTQNLKKHQFSKAGETLYHFFWDEFCDQWLEEAKPIISNKKDTNKEFKENKKEEKTLTEKGNTKEDTNKYSKEEQEALEKVLTLMYVLKTSLKLLHPFMPFITEKLWQDLVTHNITQEKLLISASWPKQKTK